MATTSSSCHKGDRKSADENKNHPVDEESIAETEVPFDCANSVKVEQTEASTGTTEGDSRYSQSSNLWCLDRPVAISVGNSEDQRNSRNNSNSNKYDKAKKAVSEAIKSVEEVTESISQTKEKDLKKHNTSPFSSSSLDSLSSIEDLKTEPEIVVARDFEADEEKKEEEEEAEAETEEEPEIDGAAVVTEQTKSPPQSTQKNNYFGGFLYSPSPPSRPTMTAGKTRVAERLTAASNKSCEVNRSGELDGLKEKFDVFTKQFKPFITTLKNYQASVVNLEHNRSEVRTKDIPQRRICCG